MMLVECGWCRVGKGSFNFSSRSRELGPFWNGRRRDLGTDSGITSRGNYTRHF
jgi:hypothetical protein